jgi:hypothetical protein
MYALAVAPSRALRELAREYLYSQRSKMTNRTDRMPNSPHHLNVKPMLELPLKLLSFQNHAVFIHTHADNRRTAAAKNRGCLKTPDAAAFAHPAVAENAAPDGMQRAQSYSTLKSSGLGYSLGGPAGTICKPKALFEKLWCRHCLRGIPRLVGCVKVS